MLGMEEQYKKNSRAPTIDAITQDISVEHESHIGENAEKTKTTRIDKKPLSLSPTLEEQHEEPDVSLFINATTEVPKTFTHQTKHQNQT